MTTPKDQSVHHTTLYGKPKGEVLGVMVVYNGIRYLKKALDSVLAELKSPYALLIVDNSSTDGSFEYIRSNFPDVPVLRTHENLGGAGGFSAGMQVAIETPDCEYVWLLDNDIIAEANSLPPLLDCLQKRKGAVAAGSQLCLYDEPEVVQAIGGMYTPWLGNIRGNHFGERRKYNVANTEVDYLPACSLLVRKKALREIGFFADVFIFFDDVDWCLRAKKMNHTLWCVPQSVVLHDFSGFKPLVPWREYYRKRNKLYCLSTHPPSILGYGSLFIYLCFVNYLAMVHRASGTSSIGNFYQLALSDFLNGIRGKRNFPSPDNNHGLSNNEVFQDNSDVYIDGKIHIGTIKEILNKLSDFNPKSVSTSKKIQSKLKDDRLIRLGVHSKWLNSEMVHIVDMDYSFFSALGSKIYRVNSDALEPVKYPLIGWAYIRLIKLMCLPISVILGLFHTAKSLKSARKLGASNKIFSISSS
jgi:GT2 family glycosyltransferase